MAMNSDGSYDAVDSGGFGKDYHGQDAFGERMTGGGIGGDGHESSFDAPEIDTTELSNTDSSFEGEANEVADSMRESIRDVNEEANENSNTGSMDTSFQIGDIEEEDVVERLKQKMKSSKKVLDSEVENLKGFDKYAEDTITLTEKAVEELKSRSANPLGRLTNVVANVVVANAPKALIDAIEKLSHSYGVDFDRAKLESDFKANGPDVITEAMKSMFAKSRSKRVDRIKSFEDVYNSAAAAYDDRLKSSTTDKTKTSFTDKMKPSTKTDKPTEVKPEAEAKAEPGKNMASAKTSPSDYLTKANKDSTKELPPSRNDFGNHAGDTLKGVVDRIVDNTTAKAIGIKSIEEFARENGYDPNKLSTMKAYQLYQNKEIMKAIPGIVKQIGSYITERVKDAVDPSQLPERIRNTLARYNLATLIGAVILSINSGAGLQTSIDQALTMVDPEDQAAVSDYLEDVLSDEGTVNDLKTAFDDALAPEQNSDTNELDESIVNIGRKDNTDYDDFNAGLGTTSSDADVKVFIARNVKADPILRKMISKIGK